MSETLIQQEEVPGVWFEEVMERVKGRAGSLFEVDRPQDAAKALYMMACGISMNKIHKEIGCNRDVLKRLAWRHSDTLDTKKKEFARSCAMAAETYKDLLIERAEQLMDDPVALSKISPEKLAIPMAILIDKSMLMSGMATTVIEHKSGSSIGDAAKIIADAKRRIREKNGFIEAEVIE